MQRSFKTEISDFSFRFIVAPFSLLPLKTCRCEEALEKFYFLLFLKEKAAFENGGKSEQKKITILPSLPLNVEEYGMDIINLRQRSPVIYCIVRVCMPTVRTFKKSFVGIDTFSFHLMMTSRKIILTLVLYSKLFGKR